MSTFETFIWSVCVGAITSQLVEQKKTDTEMSGVLGYVCLNNPICTHGNSNKRKSDQVHIDPIKNELLQTHNGVIATGFDF